MYLGATFLTTVCSCAFIGNVCIWIIILKSSELRRITYVFLLGLTTGDLLVTTLNMPITILTILSGEWIFSKRTCIISGYFNMVTLVLSVLSLCNISINRLIMVCYPFYFAQIYTPKNTAIMMSCKYNLITIIEITVILPKFTTMRFNMYLHSIFDSTEKIFPRW